MHVFSKSQCIDERSRNLTFGYIRNIENINTVPFGIKNICLLYYFETEAFGKHGEKLIISSSSNRKCNDIVHRTDTGDVNCVFGTVVIGLDNYPNAIYCWSFKVTLYPSPMLNVWPFVQLLYDSPFIGIVSARKAINNDCFSKKEYAYNFYGRDTTWKSLKCNNYNLTIASYGAYDKIKSGDIIKMEVDLKNKSIKYFHNNKDLGFTFNEIDLNYKYYLGISFADKG
eukprot:361225_1